MLTGVCVAGVLLGPWCVASFAVVPRAWLESVTISGGSTITRAPRTAIDEDKPAVFQPDPSTSQSRDVPSQRDLHFEGVLENLSSRQRQESFEAIFDQNAWGNPESRSGDGSTEAYTRNSRTLLAYTIKEYGIKDWIDSPCGDCNWQGLVEGIDDVAYLGLDIVPGLIKGNTEKYANRTNMNFKQQDFINEPFPHKPDLILCRDMIQHNSLVDGVRAYYNMEKSGAKYLATTWHQQGAENVMAHNTNQPPGGMYAVNIFLHPFNFSKPEFFIREGGVQEDRKTLGLWKLPALGLGDGQYFDIPDEFYVKAETEVVQVGDLPA